VKTHEKLSYLGFFLAMIFLCVGPALQAQESENSVADQVQADIQAGHLDAALDKAQIAVGQYPHSSDLQQLLGIALFKKGLNQDALLAFRRAIECDPSVPQNYFDVALVDLADNRYPDAAKNLETSTRLDPTNAEAHLLLGRAYHNQNQTLPAIAQFQQALFSDMRTTFQLLQNQDDRAPLHMEDLPRAFRDQFVGVTGKILLQVFSPDNLWQRDNQEKFITALRSVDPNVTGTPVQLYEYEELLKNSYLRAAWYSLAAIVLLVLFHFRSVGAVILALLPVGIGTLWLAGLMGWFGIPINLANIMTLPLVIGIGVTNGIHILNRFAEERTPNILARSTGKAVLVSGLTAIAGFGSLIIAKDRGIHSLGCVMAVGIAACMVAGLTFLPALLNLLGRWRPLIKQPSADNPSSALGQEEPRSKTSSAMKK
jgi:tetratricopeptide (TPR) repeat protein